MIDKGIRKTVEIPEEVDASLEDGTVKISGPEGELTRSFDMRGVEISQDDDEIIVESELSRKEYRASVGTAISHIKNMSKGVIEGFTFKLKLVYSHFPVTVNVRDGVVQIENFIGEEKPREAQIVGDTEVKIDGEDIDVSGIDKEAVGQTAANIEQATGTKGRDPRVFQDGIYIVERP